MANFFFWVLCFFSCLPFSNCFIESEYFLFGNVLSSYKIFNWSFIICVFSYVNVIDAQWATPCKVETDEISNYYFQTPSILLYKHKMLITDFESEMLILLQTYILRIIFCLEHTI